MLEVFCGLWGFLFVLIFVCCFTCKFDYVCVCASMCVCFVCVCE